MRENAVKGLILIIGMILFVPVVGVTGGDRFASLYGLGPLDNDLEILMRHRAVLFGLIGGFVVFSAFRVRHRASALILAAISLISFLAIAFTVSGFNQAIQGVVLIDVFAVGCLIVAVVLELSSPRSS